MVSGEGCFILSPPSTCSVNKQYYAFVLAQVVCWTLGGSPCMHGVYHLLGVILWLRAYVL